MTIQECIKRNEQSIANAIEWAHGKPGVGLDQLDMHIVCEALSKNVPAYMMKFECAENLHQFRATGAFNQIGKFLDKLSDTILKKEEYLKSL